MAKCFYFGCGVRKNMDKAIEYLNKASDRLCPDAITELGILLENRDPAAACRYYKKAAAMKHPAGSYLLARSYLRGHGIRKNKRAGNHWMTRAYELGDPMAGYYLGKSSKKNSESIH